MARLLSRVLEVFLLVVIFAIAATITSIACSVTNTHLFASSYLECVTVSGVPNRIYKYELNEVTFSDGDVGNIEVYGLGRCGTPSISGSQVKCAPSFFTPTQIACVPAASNCVRWSQLIINKSANCGFFSCDCTTVNSNQFTLAEECWNETASSCQSNGWYWNFSNSNCNQSPKPVEDPATLSSEILRCLNRVSLLDRRTIVSTSMVAPRVPQSRTVVA